jgi:hypothetical protein
VSDLQSISMSEAAYLAIIFASFLKFFYYLLSSLFILQHMQKQFFNLDQSTDDEPLSKPSGSGYRRKAAVQTAHKTEIKLFPLACNHLSQSNNEIDILGKGWALGFKKLKPGQQMFVKKAISDILFEARLETIHRISVQINKPYNHLSGSLSYTVCTSVYEQ